MGGRGSSSGMSSSTSGNDGSVSVGQAFGDKSLDRVAKDYVKDLRFRGKYGADEKYSQMQDLADGKDVEYFGTEAVRTQAFDNAPDEFVNRNSRGKATGWKIMYDENGRMTNGDYELYKALGRSTQNSLHGSLQEAAKQWLEDNPKPSASEKKYYKWDGTRYVRK